MGNSIGIIFKSIISFGLIFTFIPMAYSGGEWSSGGARWSLVKAKLDRRPGKTESRIKKQERNEFHEMLVGFEEIVGKGEFLHFACLERGKVKFAYLEENCNENDGNQCIRVYNVSSVRDFEKQVEYKLRDYSRYHIEQKVQFRKDVIYIKSCEEQINALLEISTSL